MDWPLSGDIGITDPSLTSMVSQLSPRQVQGAQDRPADGDSKPRNNPAWWIPLRASEPPWRHCPISSAGTRSSAAGGRPFHLRDPHTVGASITLFHGWGWGWPVAPSPPLRSQPRLLSSTYMSASTSACGVLVAGSLGLWWEPRCRVPTLSQGSGRATPQGNPGPYSMCGGRLRPRQSKGLMRGTAWQRGRT